MGATYQFGANPQIDYPRLLIADTDMTLPIFQDSEILAAYVIDMPFMIVPASGPTVNAAIGTPSYRRIAAGLLDCLAAQALRDTENNNGSFAIAEMVPNNFAARERVWKQLLRIDN